MTKQNIKTKEGFTIIEVVLVLAIAGLIFLMVFVALPALQRPQRDTARRNDMSRLSTALTNYQSNNNNLPATNNGDGEAPESLTANCTSSTCTFIKKYLHGPDDSDNTFADPDGALYKLSIKEYEDNMATPTNFADHVVLVVEGGKCAADEGVAAASGSRQFAVFYRLEGAGTYCVDNQ